MDKFADALVEITKIYTETQYDIAILNMVGIVLFVLFLFVVIVGVSSLLK